MLVGDRDETGEVVPNPPVVQGRSRGCGRCPSPALAMSWGSSCEGFSCPTSLIAMWENPCTAQCGLSQGLPQWAGKNPGGGWSFRFSENSAIALNRLSERKERSYIFVSFLFV